MQALPGLFALLAHLGERGVGDVGARRAASRLAAEAGRRRVQDRGMDPVACDGHQRKYLQGRDLGGIPRPARGRGASGRLRPGGGGQKIRHKYYKVGGSRTVAMNPLLILLKLYRSITFNEKEACGCDRPLALELILLAPRSGYVFLG